MASAVRLAQTKSLKKSPAHGQTHPMSPPENRFARQTPFKRAFSIAISTASGFRIACGNARFRKEFCGGDGKNTRAQSRHQESSRP